MSSYHTSFTYLKKNSYNDFKLQIVHFESGDSGETESYLSQDAIYQDSARGTRRTMYGSKYNSVALSPNPSIASAITTHIAACVY